MESGSPSVAAKRDTQLDALRALAMMHIVCVIHVFYWYGIGCELLRSALLFEMPCIFAIAGAAQSFKRGNVPPLLGFAIGKAKRVLLPFCVFLPLLYLWLAVMTFAVPPTAENHIDIRQLGAIDVARTIVTCGCAKIPNYGYTWFISCYLIVLCSFPVQARLLRRVPGWAYLAANAAVVAALTPVHFPYLENEVKNLPVYNFFFIAGYLYYRDAKRGALLAVSAVAVALTVWWFACGEAMPMQLHKFPADIYFLVFGTAWVSVFALAFSRVKLPYPPLLQVWNERGYNIYLYQIFSAYAVFRVTHLWIGGVGSGIVAFAIYFVLTLAFNTVLSRFTYAFERRAVAWLLSLPRRTKG